MGAGMITKSATMEMSMMMMAVRVTALLKTISCACHLTPQQWAPMYASATPNLSLPLGLSIGAQLKSSSALKLFTILKMGQSRPTPKSSALKFWIPQCLITKIWAPNTTAS